jgi:hypothetical protein
MAVEVLEVTWIEVSRLSRPANKRMVRADPSALRPGATPILHTVCGQSHRTELQLPHHGSAVDDLRIGTCQ